MNITLSRPSSFLGEAAQNAFQEAQQTLGLIRLKAIALI
jgi:hypothetical protein